MGTRARRGLGVGLVVLSGLLAGWLGTLAGAEESPSSALFPFVLPWDDASAGVTDISGWLHKPAGVLGYVRAREDGHLYVGDQRLRFFGTDLSHSANFPRHEDAEKVARRMAKFGINIVRFHIMDIAPFPQGLFRHDGPGTRELEPEAVDRLDYFIAQLKQNGIYVDLNLLNYRPFAAADGLPAEIEAFPRPYQDRHVPGFFACPPLLDLQKEYARTLLTHRNPYTGLSYTEDPAVAFVEICNENGLLSAWQRGRLERQPEVFLRELRRQWHAWLRQRYPTTADLRQAWSVGAQPLGRDLLLDPANPAPELSRWDLQTQGGSEADIALSEELPDALRAGLPAAPSIHLTVKKVEGSGWRVLLNRPGFAVEAGQAYTLSFWAKADPAQRLDLRLAQTQAPWTNLTPILPAELTGEWQPFRFVVSPTAAEAKARVLFGDLGRGLGTYWLAGLTLRLGGVQGLHEDERVEDESVPWLARAPFAERTPAAQDDWLGFLRETESQYWQGMYRFLKADLKVNAVVIGTASQWSVPSLMVGMDCVDAHAYWQHPVFPVRAWDRDNWYVRNRAMTNAVGGILSDLASCRLQGKPFSVTEYGHAAPNSYCAEGALLVGAYAALQDWDYISISRYTLQVDERYTWDAGRFRGYFDVDQHPGKMLGFIPAIAMFRRPDVRSALQGLTVPFGKERELAVLREHRSSYEVLDRNALGFPPGAALVHRVALATGAPSTAAAAPAPELPSGDTRRFVSDTGELTWDLNPEGRGTVTINTPRSKAVVGFGGGRRFDLGGVVVEPGPTRQDGWCAITVTAMEGELGGAPCRVLITASGQVENSTMGWKGADKSTVGKDWGQAPTLVEGIPARITLPVAAAASAAWALDERGQRRESVAPSADADGHAVLAIGPRYLTLWYEVETR